MLFSLHVEFNQLDSHIFGVFLVGADMNINVMTMEVRQLGAEGLVTPQFVQAVTEIVASYECRWCVIRPIALVSGKQPNVLFVSVIVCPSR